MPTIGKTILSNLAATRSRIAILAFFPLLLIPTGFYLLVVTYPAIADAAATSDPQEDFQAALDAFQKKYGFPGATAAYVLRDGTTGVSLKSKRRIAFASWVRRTMGRAKALETIRMIGIMPIKNSTAIAKV